MFHRVNANVLDKHRRELARKHPLWTGDVETAKQAIGAAHALLGPIFEGEPRADSIVLHITDEKGGTLTSTEYAEDWRIGRGASLGSNLLADGADHGLTPEEVDAAQRALAKRAVAAMPSVAEKLAEKSVDPVADFFGGKRPSESVPTRKTYSMPGGIDIAVEGPSDEFRDVVKRVADRQDKFAAGGLVQPHPTYGKSMVEDMLEAMEKFQRSTGAGPSHIVMGEQAFKELLKQQGAPDATKAAIHGIPVYVSKDPNAPPAQIVRKPRNNGITFIMDEASHIPDDVLKKLREQVQADMKGIRQHYYGKPCAWEFKP